MEISYHKLEFIKTHSQLDGQRIFVEGLINGLSHPGIANETIDIKTFIEGLQDSLGEINDALVVSSRLL